MAFALDKLLANLSNVQVSHDNPQSSEQFHVGTILLDTWTRDELNKITNVTMIVSTVTSVNLSTLLHTFN